MPKDEFELLMALIFEKITVITDDECEAYKEEAKGIMKEDIKDVPYVACYLALKCDGIWSNDPDYKDIGIKIFSTRELLELMKSEDNTKSL